MQNTDYRIQEFRSSGEEYRSQESESFAANSGTDTDADTDH